MDTKAYDVENEEQDTQQDHLTEKVRKLSKENRQLKHEIWIQNLVIIGITTAAITMMILTARLATRVHILAMDFDTLQKSYNDIVKEYAKNSVPSNTSETANKTTDTDYDDHPSVTILNSTMIDYRYKDVPLHGALIELVTNQAREIGIDPAVFFGIIKRESQFNDGAKSEDGHDYGLCQIRDSNFKWIRENLGEDWDPMDPRDSIKAAAFMLKTYIPISTSYTDLLMNYNLGPNGTDTANDKGIYATEYTSDVLGFAKDYGYNDLALGHTDLT